MRCSVVAIGTELLLGQIVDTNSSWLGEQLAAAGIDSLFQVKVGDNLGRIVSTLRSTLEQTDAVIICGGLGPTHDDITREAIAEIMGVSVEISTDKERIRPENSEVERLWADNSKANEVLGWKPSYAGLNGFREGLAKSIDWFTQPENLKLYKSGIYNL